MVNVLELVLLVVIGGLALAGMTVFAASLIDLALSNTRAASHAGVVSWLTATRRFAELWVICGVVVATFFAITGR